MSHYKSYHYLHIPSGRFFQRDFDSSVPGSVPDGEGLPELDALRIINLWNRGGIDHDYRYWLE